MNPFSLKRAGYRLTFVAGLGLGAIAAGPALADSEITVRPVINTWDADTPVGTSRLVRNNSGLSATFQTSSLPAGQVMTLWFVIFNNPAACFTSPCGLDDLLANEDAQADFLWGAGNIVGGSGRGNLGGHLRVGEVSRSAFIELGAPEAAVGLIDPFGAEVHLMLHSHGPLVPGRTLKAQLNSFLGGCEMFLGPDGIAAGPEDVPSAVGECSTFQVSVHP